MVITEKNSTGTRRTTESFQWPIRHAISLFFLKKIEGNRQALTSVYTSTRDDDSNTCPFSSFSFRPQIVYTEKSQKIKEWASREFGISHLVPTCEISFYDCCKFFFHSSCLKMALNVFQQMLFLRGVNFYDPFSFLKAVDKRFPIQKLPPCSTQ